MTYNDSATVITNEGAEVPVHANLRSFMRGLRPDWDGTLTAQPEIMFQLRNNRQAVLRLVNGKEGSFFMTPGSASTGAVTIMGNGDAPF